jgi:predicted HAD superfamily phosphohydrolase YqeG
MEKDTSREWTTFAKIKHAFNLFFANKHIDSFNFVDRFSEIDFDELKNIWKKWIILDIDDCIAPHHGKILSENLNIIKELVANWWKIVVHSNMKKTSRYEELEKFWIQIITSLYAKPDKRWFEECLEALWLDADKVVMIWDNFITDGWSIEAWIDFIKVKPIEAIEKNKSLSRIVQIMMRDKVDEIIRTRNNKHLVH